MICKECKLDKNKEEMINLVGWKGRRYIGHTCKGCYLKKRYSARKVFGSKQWVWYRFNKLKNNALKRDISFELTSKDFVRLMSLQKCFFCNDVNITKSIDRLNNSLGYSSQNCVMSCLTCNKLKGKILSSDKERILKILSRL